MKYRLLNILRNTAAAVLLLVMAGCTAYGLVENAQKVENIAVPGNYSLTNNLERSNDTTFMLAFSGGGTRAAALAYGVMLELRDTGGTYQGKDWTALEGVDTISSVSGGSFTSAYYGLYGDKIFEDFEDEVLRVNIEGRLIRRMFLNPLSWFNKWGRTEEAVKYYNKHIFHDATYADMTAKEGPLILINASDLGHGVRFSFVQEYFNLLNSDIATFPVARAVAASSCVPVLFDPIVVQNYQGEKEKATPEWVLRVQKAATLGNNAQLKMVTHGISSYFGGGDGDRFVHFVDGGITDNLGMRAIHDIIEISGGMTQYMEEHPERAIPSRMILISVNASAKKATTMDQSSKQPKMGQTMGAVTGIQMHRYNISTINLMEDSMKKWSGELSTPEKTVKPYFIQVKFDNVKDPEEKAFLNAIPTSFNLTDEQIDALIKAGRQLLRDHPTWVSLLAEFE
jgi:NTE family protein